MTVTTTTFLVRYPEFGDHDASLLSAVLAEAQVRYPDIELWSGVRDQAINLYMAHLLATRVVQMGSQLGMGSQASGLGLDATLYGQELKRLEGTVVATGFTV
jgi:hypothetical protein